MVVEKVEEVEEVKEGEKVKEEEIVVEEEKKKWKKKYIHERDGL